MDFVGKKCKIDSMYLIIGKTAEYEDPRIQQEPEVAICAFKKLLHRGGRQLFYVDEQEMVLFLTTW